MERVTVNLDGQPIEEGGRLEEDDFVARVEGMHITDGNTPEQEAV